MDTQNLSSTDLQSNLDERSVACVRASFDMLRPQIDLFAQAFYIRLFEQNPNIELMFQGDLKEQEAKLGNMIATIVDKLDQADKLMPMLDTLGRRHVTVYGVRPRDFESYGNALDWTLSRFLGQHFTADVAESWRNLFRFLVDSMLRHTKT